MGKRARAVIGANFGDEGKGLTVDWLCSKGDAGVVVRFNGGPQAGHTVVTPGGQRHVFRHVGSGAFHGVPTYLSQHVLVNPIAFFMELRALDALGIVPEVYASPECLVTTFADMVINRRIEDGRGADRHGSCGMGVGETIERSSIPELKITLSDIWNGVNLESKIAEICDKYARFRTGKPIDEPKMAQSFLRAVAAMPEAMFPAGIGQCKDPVFEGAQGLLLSQGNKQFFPHVSRSFTGSKNVRELCALGGFDDLELWYVTRTYLTRHGAGPLPGEDAALSYTDDTNGENDYQGRLRFAPLDIRGLGLRIAKDAGTTPCRLVATHCDQEPPAGLIADVLSHGPTRDHVQEV